MSAARTTAVLIVVGLVGGFLSGLFGVGGGIVMVPLIVSLLGYDQRRASALSLAAIVPTAVAGAIGYGLRGEIDLVAGALVGAGGIAGSLLGTRLLRRLSLGWLRWLFLALLVVVAVHTLVEVPTRGGGFELQPLAVVGLAVLGLLMGIASGLFGIGGGVLAVPMLIAVFGAGDLLARGTSLVAMVPTAFSGTTSNARVGLVRPLHGLMVGLAAVAASFPGVALAFVIPPWLSAVLFAALMAVSAAQLIAAGIRSRRLG